MRRIFVDSSFYLAVFNPTDELHERAVAFARRNRQPTLTSEYVIIEVGNALRRIPDRALFSQVIALIEADPHTLIVRATPQFLSRAIALFESRSDKEWSLVDCTSMIIMGDHEAQQVVTGDHHFQQAGFEIVL